MERNRERVTRADVAKAAGVSETIVSYVVNNREWRMPLRPCITVLTMWQEL